jgi:nitroreductase
MTEINNFTKESVSKGLSFNEVVRLRKACRRFLPRPVALETITSVLEDAQQSPSNCNTQPWSTHIVSGKKLEELSEAILQAKKAEDISLDFSFDENHFYGRYAERQKAQGKVYYESIGVAREDKEARKAASDYGCRFFGAPHVAFLFMPSFGDNVRVAGDLGMYGQTFLLSLVDHGLAGIPMTALAFFADTIRQTLHISDEFNLLFGMPFGYADLNAPGAEIKLGRDEISRNVIFHQ